MLNILKRQLVYFVTIVLSISLSATALVHAVDTDVRFTATDGGTYGNALSWYPRKIVTKFTNMPGDTVNITYTLNDKVLDTGPTSPNYGTGGFEFDATTLVNGNYKLRAVLNTPSRHLTAKTWAGTEYLSFTVNNVSTPTAFFSTADNGTFGNSLDWYPRKVLTGFLQKSEGITEITYQLDGVTIGTNTKISGNADGIEYDVTKTSNGQHKLVAILKTESGVVGKAKTYGGNEFLTFTVSNKATDTSSQDTSTGVTTCNARQQNFDKITARIISRTESQFEVIQSIASNLDSYHAGLKNGLTDYTTIIKTLREDEAAAQSALVDVVATSYITCDDKGQPKTAEFKKNITTLLEAISKYKTDTLELIVKLEKN